jgi:tRNA (adenine22-N1)-methyltransferase
LSERIRALFDLVPPSGIAAEIGADHGILSARLLLENRCARMIISDISAASLSKARRLIARYGLQERAEFRLADGLTALDRPVNAIIIAGMGAEAIRRMLSNGQDMIEDASLILQPNLDHTQLRRHLMESGFRIDSERLVMDDGRFYVAIRAVRGAASYSPVELLLGPALLHGCPPLFYEYVCWRRDCLALSRRAKEQAELALIKQLIGG